MLWHKSEPRLGNSNRSFSTLLKVMSILSTCGILFHHQYIFYYYKLLIMHKNSYLGEVSGFTLSIAIYILSYLKINSRSMIFSLFLTLLGSKPPLLKRKLYCFFLWHSLIIQQSLPYRKLSFFSWNYFW